MQIMDLGTGVVVLLWVFFWFYSVVDTRLVHFRQQPLFLFDRSFFLSFLNQPGGVGKYLDLFFYQFNAWRGVGALVAVLLAAISIFLTHKLLVDFYPIRIVSVLHYIPVALWLTFDAYNVDSIGLLNHYWIALATVIAYRKTRKWPVVLERILWLILAALLFYGWGGTVLLLFLLTVFAAEMNEQERKSIGILPFLWIIPAAGFPWLASRFSYFMGFQEAIGGDFYPLEETRVAQWMLFLIPVVFVGFSSLFKAAWRKVFPSSQSSPAMGLALSILIVAATIITGFLTFQPEQKASVQFHYDARELKWDKVLEAGARQALNDRK
ncbi:MAG TPA: DUF6057 family protein, partial [Prolixibacteraceae bacterium]|nr:DUF6057 family protein [Prolixibacteraceae bacterium]